jgi:hypothetical protein
MSGVVTVQGRDIPGVIGASRSDAWTEMARDHMTKLGFPLRRIAFLSNHVEVKAVVMMLQNHAREGAVTINHAPCGSEPDSRTRLGCHQSLSALLPAGHTLTVYGTTQNGEPFEHTYEGTATP